MPLIPNMTLKSVSKHEVNDDHTLKWAFSRKRKPFIGTWFENILVTKIYLSSLSVLNLKHTQFRNSFEDNLMKFKYHA